MKNEILQRYESLKLTGRFQKQYVSNENIVLPVCGVGY
jgi:hypothetical protein